MVKSEPTALAAGRETTRHWSLRPEASAHGSHSSRFSPSQREVPAERLLDSAGASSSHRSHVRVTCCLPLALMWKLIEHQIDDHTGDRNIHPNRIGVANPFLVRDNTTFLR